MSPPNARDLDSSHPDENRIVRTLLSLPEMGMRVPWLHERLRDRPLDEMARHLDRIAQRSQSADPGAKEALLAVAILISQLHETAWHFALSQSTKSQHLLNLERLLRRHGEEDSSPLSPPEQRAPDYGVGRELTVGERRSMARRPTRAQLERLLYDPHPLVLEQLFQSSSLTEGDIVTIATRRPPCSEALRLLIATPRFITRRKVRLSLILNPGTPHGIALPFVSTLPREDLKLIAGATTVNQTLRTVAHELCRVLPPVHESTNHPLRH